MRHNVAHRKLGRVTEHRLALLRNQAIALLRHEQIETTMPKAKELRPFVERLITIAKRGVAAGEANGKTLHARRHGAGRAPRHAMSSASCSSTLAPRFAERPGGYTRILRVGFRRGDAAEVAQVELVGSDGRPRPQRPKDGGGRRGAEEDQGRRAIASSARRSASAASKDDGRLEGAGRRARRKGEPRRPRRRGRPAGRRAPGRQAPSSRRQASERNGPDDVPGPFTSEVGRRNV